MSPAILGEFCARCGAKSTVQIEPEPNPDGSGQDVLVFRCPNGHGVQLIQQKPPVDPPVEVPPVDPPVIDQSLPDQAPVYLGSIDPRTARDVLASSQPDGDILKKK